MSYSLLLCVNVLYIEMLSLVFSGITTEKSISVPSGPFTVIYLLSFLILYLFAFTDFFCRPTSVQPLILYYVILRKVDVKYIYHAVKLTNSNF